MRHNHLHTGLLFFIVSVQSFRLGFADELAPHPLPRAILSIATLCLIMWAAVWYIKITRKVDHHTARR